MNNNTGTPFATPNTEEFLRRSSRICGLQSSGQLKTATELLAPLEEDMPVWGTP
jgi:hypothetical protein